MCPLTEELMVDPVLAEDGETYELSAILEWLEDFDTSPLQPSIYIDAETLRFNKVVYEMIADLVASNTLDEETMAKWHARKDEPERLFDDDPVLNNHRRGAA